MLIKLVVPWDQNARQSHNMKTCNSSFERVEELKYLGTTLIKQNPIQEEITSRMKSGNACYHLVQNLLSSSLLTNNTKIKTYRTIILLVSFVWVWNLVLTLREECRLRVSENRVLRIFGPKKKKVTGDWRKLHNEELNDIYSSPNIIQGINWEEWD